MIDLSFLTEEEQESIRSVLRRDAELKKAEEKRVQSLQRNIANKEQLRYMTGEWFYETKQLRHRDRIHGADIIRASMRHTQRPLTILELSHLRKEQPSFVSSESREVFVPPVLQGVLQDPQLELSEEMYEIRTPSPPAENNPRPVSVSPMKERKNPFNSEDFVPEEKSEDPAQTENEEPLSSCDSCTAPISDLDQDLSESQISKDASVPFPISEPRAGSATSEETSELDEPEDRQTSSAVPRSILKHLSLSSSLDSLCPHVDPQNPFCTDSPPEDWIDRKQVRFSSMVGQNRADNQDGKDLGEHYLLDVDFMVSARDERHSSTDVDSHGPSHDGQMDSQEDKDHCKARSVIQGSSKDQQDVHDDVSGHATKALCSAIEHESGKLVDSKTGPEEDLDFQVTTTDQPEVAVESSSESVRERGEDVKEEMEEVREPEQDGPDDSATFYQSTKDTTVEKGVTERRKLSEPTAVKTVQLTAMQKTTFKESFTSVDPDDAVQHPDVPSNLRLFCKKEHIVSAGEEAERNHTTRTETEATSEAESTNNKLLSQVETTEKTDCSLIVVLSKEDGTYRANPVLIYEESEDILTASIRETDMFKIQESSMSPAPSLLPLHGQKQKEESLDAPPQPSSPTPQEDRRAKISDLKNFWEKEVTKSREQAANVIGRSFRNKVASPQSDIRTFSLREKFEGAGPSKPSIIPKSLTVTEKGFVRQSLRSPEDVQSVGHKSREQADPEPQNKPLSPRRSQILRAKEQDGETRRSPSKTCHPRVLPREPSCPKSQGLEGSPLKTFPIDIDPGTKNVEEPQMKPSPVPKERKSPSHEAKLTPSPSPRVRDSPSHIATPTPAPAPRERRSPGHEAKPEPAPVLRERWSSSHVRPTPAPSPRVRNSSSHEAKPAPVLRERRSSSHEVKLTPTPRERMSPSHEAKQMALTEPRNNSNIRIGDANTQQSPSKSSSPQHRGKSERKQTALTESKSSSYVTVSDENALTNTPNLSSPQHKKAPEKKLGTLTRLARSIIPQDYQYYLGPHEKAHVPPFTQESDDLHSPQKSLRNTVGILRASPTKGSPSRKKDEDPSQDMATGTCSLPRTSSGSYDDTPNIIMTSLRELSSKIKSTSKSLDNLASKTKKEKNQENPKEATNQSMEDVSSSPSSSSEWKQLKSSVSVPVLQQEETDSDSTLDTNLGVRRNTGSSRSNLSVSSGLASMSSVSGSISSIYPADFGDIEVQGNIQFAVNYIQKLGEFHIFVVQCRDLAVADTKKQRSDPYVKCYLLPDKTKLGKRKTAVKKKTLNPDYNEILRFKIPMEVLKTQNLNVSVWHNDTFGRNSFLGDVEVDLSEWNFSNTHINDYALKAGVSAPTPALAPSLLLDSRGQMRVALRFLPQTPSGQSTAAMETSEVQIWVKDCKNLPPVRGVVIDPFVKCAVLPDTSRKSRQKTRVVKRTANPMFNHTMVYDGFRPDDLREACVEITVWDHDRLNNHYIGGVRLGLGTGKSYGVEVGWMDSTADEAHLWQRMLEADGEWVEDVLPLRMLVLAKSMSK